MYEQIRYEVSDPIATIALNRPKALNASSFLEKQPPRFRRISAA